jgi:hypothetical protein
VRQTQRPGLRVYLDVSVSVTWNRDSKPECTYVMKDGDNLPEYLSREPTSDESDSGSAMAPVSEAVSEIEESDTPPQPPEDSEDDRVQGGTVKYFQPLCPLRFREECPRGVSAIDQSGAQIRVDPDTGETIITGEDNALLQAVVGVIWSDKYVTMRRSCDKSVSSDVLCLRNLVLLVDLCPSGNTLTLWTHSQSLIAEWDKMCQWREHGCEGLQRADVPRAGGTMRGSPA